jgi:hypothetical protein
MEAGLPREYDQCPPSASDPCTLLLARTGYVGVCSSPSFGDCGHGILLDRFQVAGACPWAGHGLYRLDPGDISSGRHRARGGSAPVCLVAVIPRWSRLFAGACVSGKLRLHDAACGDLSLSRSTLSLLGDPVCGRHRHLFLTEAGHSPSFGATQRSLGYGSGGRPWSHRVPIRHPHFKAEGKLRSQHDQWMAGQFLLSSRT